MPEGALTNDECLVPFASGTRTLERGTSHRGFVPPIAKMKAVTCEVKRAAGLQPDFRSTLPKGNQTPPGGRFPTIKVASVEDE